MSTLSSLSRTIIAVLLLSGMGFVAAVGFGYWEIRRPTPPAPPAPAEVPPPTMCVLDRVPEAEALLGDHAVCVYKFTGGFPTCWVDIDSEGNRQTLGPWKPLPHPLIVENVTWSDVIPESIEGHLALFAPSGTKQTYRLGCAVRKARFPKDANGETHTVGFYRELLATVPDLLPERDRSKEKWPGTTGGSGGSRGMSYEGGKPRSVPPGHEEMLNFISWDTASGKKVDLTLRVRFLTAEEVAAAGKKH